MSKILISSCLLGEMVRYDGRSLKIDHPFIEELKREDKIVQCCPEILAGFSVPRLPAEINYDNSRNSEMDKIRILQNDGLNVTDEFWLGATRVLEIAKKNKVRMAILKDGSPSCGSSYVYDGTFSGRTIPGKGVLALLLSRNNIAVFSYEKIELAKKYYYSEILR